MYLKKLGDKKAAGIIDETEPIAVGSDATFIYQTVKGEGNGNSVLTPCEQEIFSQVAESLGNMAFNLDRNHMKSMINARRNNVVILILPSKTSITSQPNDSSVNMVLATLISRNVKRANICSTDQMSVVDFLNVLKSTWEEHVSNESNLLLITEENKATRGFVKTGLCPLDYDCENWTEAIKFFSELSRLERERAEADGVVVSSNTWTVRARDDAPVLSIDDIHSLLEELPNDYEDIPYLDLANLVLHKLLDTYVTDPKRDPEVAPSATTSAERIALRVLKFESAYIRADTTPYTPEEKQKQHERSVLYSTPMDKSINLRHRVSREEVDGLKVGVDEIFISSGGTREFLTKNQVLLRYEVLPSKLILSEQDRARISRKKRRDRQQRDLELERKAKSTAKEHRLALLRDEFRKRLLGIEYQERK